MQQISNRRKSVPLYLGKRQIINLFLQLNEKDKLDAYQKIKSNLFISRYNQLADELHDSELTMDELTAEVKAVRKARYESNRQGL